MGWPATAEELVRVQRELGRARPNPWRFQPGAVVGGCFVCFPRGPTGRGGAGDPAWAAAVAGGAVAAVSGEAGAPYEAGLLALREGPLLEAAVRALPAPPDVLLVNATGLDHPRGAGLALHLGSVLCLPTVGVTHRPLFAVADGDVLRLDGKEVGRLVTTRAGTRPLAVHAAWRTDPETAVAVVLASCRGARTPEPLREARRLARLSRSRGPRSS